MSIELPPLPAIRDWPHSREELRARDLDVAKVALEAAAKTTEGYWDGRQERLWAEACANAIRELEVSHDA